MNKIQRTADTDDDGSGTTGTIHNNAWKTAIYNAVDDASADLDDSTATGGQNNFALAQYGATVLRWNGASDVTFTGFANGIEARQVLVINATSARNILFAYENTDSTTTNRFITESVIGQYIGPGGLAHLVYDSTSSRWRVSCLDPGAPIKPAFDAGDFIGSGSMTWTVAAGDIETYAFTQRGKRLIVDFSIKETSVGGTPDTALQIAIPGSFAAVNYVANGCVVNDNNGGYVFGFVQVAPSGTILSVYRSSTATWSAATDTTSVRGQIAFEVN